MSFAYPALSNSQFHVSALNGRSCLITGAASGLGLSVAKYWIDAGAYVTCADILPEEKGQDIIANLGGRSGYATYVRCDVSKWEDQVKAFKRAIAFSPKRTLDIVATFAGKTGGLNLVESLEDEVNVERDPDPPSVSAFEVNLLGGYYSALLALHWFRLKPTQDTQKDSTDAFTKSLILVSSLAAYMDFPDTSYTSSKYGVRGLFRSIRDRAQKMQNVRCNNIAPWHMRTAQTAELEQRFQAKGLRDGSGYTFTKTEVLLEAVSKCAIDEDCSGRSFGIMPEGYVDLHEDFEHGYAGVEVTKALQRRLSAGDHMA